MAPDRPLIVGIGGTARRESSSERALRLALAAAERAGAATRLFAGDALAMETYDPTQPQRSARSRALVAALREADGVLIATPSYHGSISGLVKNAIDHTEDLRGDARPYLEGRAVGCIVCAEGVQAMGSTLMALRAVVHALRGWPTPFAAVVNTAQRPFDAEGRCADAALQQQLELVARQVMQFARLQRLRMEEETAP